MRQRRARGNQRRQNQRFVAFFRECASSRDAFVYIASIFLLEQCGLPLPCFTLSKSDAALEMADVPVRQWSIDHVCAWVGQSSFRAYKHAFREGLVMRRMRALCLRISFALYCNVAFLSRFPAECCWP